MSREVDRSRDLFLVPRCAAGWTMRPATPCAPRGRGERRGRCPPCPGPPRPRRRRRCCTCCAAPATAAHCFGPPAPDERGSASALWRTAPAAGRCPPRVVPERRSDDYGSAAGLTHICHTMLPYSGSVDYG